MARAAAVLLCMWILSAVGVDAAQSESMPDAQIARMDELWATRDDSGGMAAAVAAGGEVLAADPQNYEAEWRLARAYFWLAATQPNRISRKALAVKAIEWADRARTQRPDRVEGHYFTAIAVGEYAETVGMVQAIVDGVAGKVESAARRAYEIDRDFGHGAAGTVLGRFYFLLPWPKRDLHRSQMYLEEVVSRHPDKLIARQYLAETYYALGAREQARTQLMLVLTSQTAPDTERDLPVAKPLAAAAMQEWFPRR